MLNIGDSAPDFVAHTAEGDVTLAALCAEGPFVLYFYPADFTPICTKQACMFRDIHPELVAAGVRVVGVSSQGDSSHEAFRHQHDLPFPLLPDKDEAIAGAFGVKGPFGLTRRASFLMDGDGRVVDRLVADLRVARHEAFARKAIERFGKR
ncbi:MAG: peroxiredoxin [Myxococcales bacterium]|nr:peroxiredoxin [Myxococcales bacterium]